MMGMLAFPQEHAATQQAADGHGGPFNLGDMLAHHILNAA